MARATRAAVATVIAFAGTGGTAQATAVGEAGYPSTALGVFQDIGPVNVTLTAPSGSRTQIRITEASGVLTARGDSGPLSQPVACLAIPVLGVANCRSATPLPVVGYLGEGDDSVDARGLPRLGVDVWDLRGGDDTFRGGPSDEVISPGRGNDDISGGAGFSHVDYFDLIGGPVRVSLDGVANDGDGTGNIRPDIDAVTGSGGDDVLVGSEGPNALSGGNGVSDLINGLGGDDHLTLDGGVADGGAGDDTIRIYAIRGPAIGRGGDGNDLAWVPEGPVKPITIELGGGDDVADLGGRALQAGEVTVSCGAGDDRVENVKGLPTIASDCETVVPAP